ncbi:MAG TPA: zf-HC2 domain-containing protein [Frankiaceae bacterium]|nr:zf-HC2 domain-containing protein [Frankiaceae bacterium]
MTDQHATVEQLAAYAAGDLDATAALEVEAHVLLCDECRADVTALQRVGADLGAVEQVAMPADVAARIDAALAAERSGAAAPATGPAGDVLPMTRKRRGPSFAGLAAVAAGVALVAAISVPLVTGDRGGRGDGATMASEAPTKRLASRLDYDANSPRTALQLALSGRTGEPAAAALDTDIAADTRSRDDAKSSAPAAAEGAAPPALMTTRGEVSELQADPARLAACVSALAAGLDPAPKPLLVDFAQFEGRPALIVVFPTVVAGKVRPDRVDFWAVGPRCGITAGDDDVLHFARFGRPAGL